MLWYIYPVLHDPRKTHLSAYTLLNWWIIVTLTQYGALPRSVLSQLARGFCWKLMQEIDWIRAVYRYPHPFSPYFYTLTPSMTTSAAPILIGFHSYHHTDTCDQKCIGQKGLTNGCSLLMCWCHDRHGYGGDVGQISSVLISSTVGGLAQGVTHSVGELRS